MVFGYLTLAVAFFLSAVAAYYSVLGLVAIFSAAVIPVMIMGGALETGKVIAAMWLHRNWDRATWTYKAYLLPSLLALMLLTSMGTFGYLSKAHSDQNLVSGDVLAKISIYDEKIKIAKENIDANRRALKQLDEAVDQVMGRSTDEKGADKAVAIRRSQGKERARLLSEIETEQKKISQLNEQAAPIRAEVRKVEAEVGPIKYIAALLYGDNPEANLLESAVRWVIILIVVVFDPLAIVLILAGTRHLEWERALRTPKITTTTSTSTSTSSSTTSTSSTSTSTTSSTSTSSTTTTTTTLAPVTIEEPIELVDKISQVKDILPEYVEMPSYSIVDNENVLVDGQILHHRTLRDIGYGSILDDIARRSSTEYVSIDLLPKPDTQVTFGKSFPKRPLKGHMHINVAVIPNTLHKFNGDAWIEVDKNSNTSYSYDESYIRYLIDRLENGEIKPEDVNAIEIESIEEYLKNVKSNYNAT